MRNNIGFGQFLILIVLCFLLFGDFLKYYSIIKMFLKDTYGKLSTFALKNSRKKRN